MEGIGFAGLGLDTFGQNTLTVCVGPNPPTEIADSQLSALSELEQTDFGLFQSLQGQTGFAEPESFAEDIAEQAEVGFEEEEVV